MCGVLGSITNSDLNYGLGIKSMYHRGPDYSNIFTHNNLTLAHSRLSIIDLHSDSNQPFTIGHYTIVFNGEIYNYLELKQILIREGHKFKTNGETKWFYRGG